MQSEYHLKTAPILGLLYFIGGAEGVVIAMSASLLIDLDHLHLLIKEKAFTIKKIIELNKNLYSQDSIQRCFKDVTYAFHSVELNIMLLILTYWYPPLFYVLIGFSFHIICDIIHHHRHKLPILSWLILTTYFIRLRKNADKKS